MSSSFLWVTVNLAVPHWLWWQVLEALEVVQQGWPKPVFCSFRRCTCSYMYITVLCTWCACMATSQQKHSVKRFSPDDLSWYLSGDQWDSIALLLVLISSSLASRTDNSCVCIITKKTQIKVTAESYLGLVNPFTPKSAQFKTDEKITNFILQKQTAPLESTAQ